MYKVIDAGSVVQILWYLLETRSPVSCIACRLIEVYTLCVQHATEWPQVAVFLIHDMNLPKVVIHKLSKLTDPKQRPDRRSHARQLAAEERALSLVSIRLECTVHFGRCCIMLNIRYLYL